MDEQQIRNIVREEMQNNYGYGSPEIPPHTHDGISNLKISEDALLLGNKYSTLLQTFSESGNNAHEETFTFKNITNISRVSINGFGANNAGLVTGESTTKRAIINGEAIFGVTNTLTGADNYIVPEELKVPFVQSCASMYVDSSDLTKNRVSTTQDFLAIAKGPALSLAQIPTVGMTYASLATAWTGLTGTIPVEFIDSVTGNTEYKIINVTLSSTEISWSGGLTIGPVQSTIAPILCSLKVDRISNSSITFSSMLYPNWTLNVSMMIT